VNNTVGVRKLRFSPIGVVFSQLYLVRAEWLFTIRYPNVVIRSLCGNLDISLNYHATTYFQLRNSVGVFRSQAAIESERCSFKSHILVALLNSLADFATEIHFSPEQNGHANAPIVSWVCLYARWYLSGGEKCVSLSALFMALVQFSATAEYFKELSVVDHMYNCYALYFTYRSNELQT